MSDELYSYHAFLFPFEWQYTGKDFATAGFEQKTNLAQIKKWVEAGNWDRKFFEPNESVLQYNEYNYFYDFARDILYDQKTGETDPSTKEDGGFMANYFYRIEPDTAFYRITAPTQNGPKEYRLHIDSIVLHIYSTGVGVISIHLNNREKEQSSPEDILMINQFGRRLYPPFFGVPGDSVGANQQWGNTNFEFGLSIIRGNELAYVIEIDGIGREDFLDYSNQANFKHGPFRIPSFIKNLFTGVPLTVNRGDLKNAENKLYIAPLLDDRMFVVCWYGDDKTADEVTEKGDEKLNENLAKGMVLLEAGQKKYQLSNWWYRYLFVDGKDATCQDSEMMKRLLKEQTYTRWLGYNSLQGVSRYSFVHLSKSLPSLRNYNAAFTVNHTQTMYYKMCELVLVQRACLLRFSDEVSAISSMTDPNTKQLAQRVGSLYKQYLRFVNKIYFREITAQEQGIEIYQLLQRTMQIKEQITDLNAEMQELHNYVVMLEERERNANIELLTLTGGLFIIPSFIVGFLGMNLLTQGNEAKTSVWQLLAVVLVLLLTPAIFLFRFKRHSQKERFALFAALILFFLILFFVSKYLFKIT